MRGAHRWLLCRVSGEDPDATRTVHAAIPLGSKTSQDKVGEAEKGMTKRTVSQGKLVQVIEQPDHGMMLDLTRCPMYRCRANRMCMAGLR